MSYVVFEDEEPEEDYNTWHQKGFRQDFSRSPVVETLPSNAEDVDLIPGCRAMLHVLQHSHKVKRKKRKIQANRKMGVRESSMHRELHKLLGGRATEKSCPSLSGNWEKKTWEWFFREIFKDVKILCGIQYMIHVLLKSPLLTGLRKIFFTNCFTVECIFFGRLEKKIPCYYREKPEATDGRQST